MFYYTYVLQSKNDGNFYVGSTDSLQRRIKEHQLGMVKSTRDRRPIELIYFEGYRDKKVAMLRERYLKTGWGRNYLNKLLKI